MNHTHYQILGVSRTATKKDIQEAYRILAKMYHPDKEPNNKTAEEYFKKVNAAYEVLRNDIKRKQYDAMLLQKQNTKRNQLWWRAYRQQYRGSTMSLNQFEKLLSKYERKANGTLVLPKTFGEVTFFGLARLSEHLDETNAKSMA